LTLLHKLLEKLAEVELPACALRLPRAARAVSSTRASRCTIGTLPRLTHLLFERHTRTAAAHAGSLLLTKLLNHLHKSREPASAHARALLGSARHRAARIRRRHIPTATLLGRNVLTRGCRQAAKPAVRRTLGRHIAPASE